MRGTLTRRVLIAGGMLVATVAGTLATALPASAAPTTIKMTDQNKPSDVTFVDVGTPGFSPGDELLFHTNLLCKDNCGPVGAKIGTADVQCTFMLRNMQDCNGTLRFFGQGKVSFAGVVPGSNTGFVFSVTGGTGTYQGAAGSLYANTKNATDAGNGEVLVLQLV